MVEDNEPTGLIDDTQNEMVVRRRDIDHLGQGMRQLELAFRMADAALRRSNQGMLANQLHAALVLLRTAEHDLLCFGTEMEHYLDWYTNGRRGPGMIRQDASDWDDAGEYTRIRMVIDELDRRRGAG